MPKEVVQYPATDGISGTELSAHWQKDASGEGLVQLAITNHVWGRIGDRDDEDSLVSTTPIHSGGADCAACAARAEAMQAVGDPPEHGAMVEVHGASVVGEFDPSVSIITKPMTRAEINKLIRTLRKARDDAFGTDA